MAIIVMYFCQMGQVMAVRSEKESIFKIGVFSNKPLVGDLLIKLALQLMIIYVPFLSDVFKTQALNCTEFLITNAEATIIFWSVEFEKLLKRIKSKN